MTDTDTHPTTRPHTPGLVATTSLLTPARSMWPVAFLLCSVAAALAATRKPEDEDSRVTISYLSRGRSGGGGRRRVGGVGGSGGAEIEGLAFPLEKKEWIYPAQ